MPKEIEKIIKKVQSDSDKKTQRYLGMLDENRKSDYKAIKERLDSIDEKLEKHDKTLETHSEQLANALVDLNGIRIDMGKVSYDMGVTLDRKVDKKHFVDLEGRVRVLEKV